jgi:hypothetical protein
MIRRLEGTAGILPTVATPADLGRWLRLAALPVWLGFASRPPRPELRSGLSVGYT